jgi:hypothetical protein
MLLNKKNVYKFIFVKSDSRYLAVRKNKVTAIVFFNIDAYLATI